MKKNSIVKTNKKRNSLLASTALVAAGIALLATSPALAEVGATELPTGGTVAEGSASFSNPDASTLKINQSSDRVVIDWASFNIGENATTEFVQPGSGSLAVNRIHDADASQILGTLKANGTVMLLNSNGVLFGKNATIDVGGIIASTGDLANTDAFMNGANPVLSNFGDGSVINNATITVADAGLAAFVAPTVVNNGIIVAKAGRIGLAGANGNTTVTVDLYGDGLFELAAGTQSGSVSADNHGTASAEGGTILLTAATAKNIVDGVINTDGILDVQSVTVEGGKIILSAGENGDVTATGTMDASGTNGGTVDIYGQNVTFDAAVHADGGTGGDGNGGDVYIIGENTATVRGTITAKGGANGGNGGFVETSGYGEISVSDLGVNTYAPNGDTGTWLIDPNDLTVDEALATSISGSLSNYVLQGYDSITFGWDINITAADVSLTAEAGTGGINGANNYLRTNGGDVAFDTTGAVSLNTFTIYTRGGDVSLNGDSVSINNNAAISTSGGNVDITATNAVSINRSKIDATGGLLAGGIVLNDDSTAYQAFKSNEGTYQTTFETGLNGGTITITGGDLKNVKHSGNCFAAGGDSCGVADPIPLINLVIYLDEYFKTYGEDDPLFSWDGLFDDGALEDGDSLTFSMTREAGENAGSYIVSETDVVLANTSGAEYTLNIVDGTLTINKADLTVTANPDSKTYDGLTYTGGNGLTYNGFAFDDNAADLGGSLNYTGDAQGAVDAGTYTITADGYTSGNYNISYVGGTLTVDKAMLTVTADSQTMTYGGVMPTLTATYDGFVNSEDTNDLTTLATVTSGTAATANAGTYTGTLTASGAGADNYDFTYVAGDLTINKADLLVMAEDDSKTYDGLAYTGGNGVSYDGFVNGDDAGDLGGLLTYGGTAQSAVDANTYSITVSGLTSGNYNIGYEGGVLTVDQATLTVTADSFNKTYGDTYAFTGTEFTTSGLVNSETLASATLASDGADATAVVDSYDITITDATGGTANLDNYDVTYVGGALTVDKADLTITANSDSKVYGSTYTFDGDGFTYDGLVNSDSVTFVALDSDGAPATATVGEYDINADGAVGTGLDNYNITYVEGTLDVTPADLTLTIAADDATKTYGETFTFNGTEYTTSGLLNDDEVTGVTLASDGAAATANVANYDIVISDATGAGLGNYSISYVNGTLTVTKADLLVTANDGSKTYGETYGFDGDEFTFSGLLNDDEVTSVTLTSDGADAGANATIYDIVVSAATGTGLGNYDITYAKGTLTVNKADLLVSANDGSKTYDGLEYDGGNGVTYGGFVNGDDAGDLGGLLIYGGTAQGAVDADTYTITASGCTSDNYNIDYTGGILTVNKADLLLAANDGSKTYGEAYSFDGDEYGATGLVAGDVIDSVALASLGADATADAGDYTITIGGATGDDLANYNVDYVDGTLTVAPATLTIAADGQSKNFGETDPELTYQITEGALLFEDELFGELSRAEGEAAGEYTIFQNGLSAGTNYTITYVGNVLTIRPLAPQPEADIAQEDIFRTVDRAEENGVGLSVTVTGLPVLPGAANAPGVFELAAIEPAAGGDAAQTAEDVAAIEPAAGNGEFAGCWDDAIFGAETGVNTTYSFDYAPRGLLEDTANCGTATVSE